MGLPDRGYSRRPGRRDTYRYGLPPRARPRHADARSRLIGVIVVAVVLLVVAHSLRRVSISGHEYHVWYAVWPALKRGLDSLLPM